MNKGERLDGLEREVHDELAQYRNNPASGVLVPWDIPLDLAAAQRGRVLSGGETRALDASTGTGGIVTQFSATMIEVLRSRMVTKQAGARVLAGLVGTFSLPRQSAAGTLSWAAIGSAPGSGTNPTLDKVDFTPKTAGAYVDISRAFMKQATIDAEMMVRDDLVNIVAIGLDAAGLNGTGSNNQPTGVLQNSSVTTVAIASTGGDPTWAMIVGLEETVDDSNAMGGALAYITSPKGRGKFKRTLKVSGYPEYLQAGADLNGYPCYATTSVPKNLTKSTGTALTALAFGNWNELVYGLWGGLDLIVDPYTNSTSGGVRLVALQEADVQLRHTASFAKCVDIATS
jgi:HK97 family phage major capsid protein